ncbi:MAG: hypothetical protein AAGD01_16065 [Acidobacteriota bacterium]
MAESFAAEQAGGSMLTYYPIRVTYSGLPANGNSTVLIFEAPQDEGRWSLGDNTQTLGGLSFASTAGGALVLDTVNITAKQMVITAADSDVNMQVDIYVLTPLRLVNGTVNLPPGTSVTFSSAVDSQTVSGSSNWSLNL